VLERGRVVIPTAGKERDTRMAVVRQDGDGVWIADGRRRRLAAPKRKNPRHLRLTPCRLPEEALATDRQLRRALAALETPAEPKP
jgi:ribosomal protein L14E/L6E/L27E